MLVINTLPFLSLRNAEHVSFFNNTVLAINTLGAEDLGLSTAQFTEYKNAVDAEQDIVLHCSDTRPSQDFTLKKLTASHRARGFGEYPGYHFYVRRDGTLYYCRPLSIKGCHVKNYNAHSIGVCYEGGHRDDPPVLPVGNISDLSKIEFGATSHPPIRGDGGGL